VQNFLCQKEKKMLFRHKSRNHVVRPKSLKFNNSGSHPVIEWWIARILVELDVWEKLNRDFFEDYDNLLSYEAVQCLYENYLDLSERVEEIRSEKKDSSSEDNLPQNLKDCLCYYHELLGISGPLLPHSIFKTLDKWEKRVREEDLFTPEFSSNLDVIRESFNLSEEERNILGALMLIKRNRDLYSILDFFDYSERGLLLVGDVLSILLDIPIRTVRHVLSSEGKLRALGFIDVEGRLDRDDIEDLFEISDELKVPQLFSESISKNSLFEDYLEPFGKGDLSLEDYDHIPYVRNVLLPYLKAKKSNDVGINILLYGPPGTGKTELCKLVARELGCEIYEAKAETKKGYRWDNFLRSQAILSKKENCILAVDEAEDLFNSESVRNDKCFINRWLEQNKTPVVWMTNSLSFIDSAMIRRFQIVLKVENPPQHKMKELAQKKLGEYLSLESIERITHTPRISPAIINQIATIAEKMSTLQINLKEDDLMGLIEEKLHAQGFGSLANKSRSLSLYDSKLTNASCDLQGIADGIKHHPSARLCLYGPPGTGKTAYAQWLADYLGKPLIARKGSDLLGMYVGQTEHNIAAAFMEAKRAGAVLLIDEADSFLQDRTSAVRSWEVTRVNEFLTQMESFEGIFIATTNFMDCLDKASLRRFDMKAKFDFMRPDQVQELYKRYADKWGFKANPDIVRGLRNVTPGDFAAVNRRMKFTNDVNEESFFAALKEEVGIKEGTHSRIGF